MSRTYRKQPYSWRPTDPLIEWLICEDKVTWADVEYSYCNMDFGWSRFVYYTVKYKADSVTGRKLLARAKMDKVSSFKEPGPSWFRNLFEERPLRRKAKREIQRYMYDEEYEPHVDSIPRKKIYWT